MQLQLQQLQLQQLKEDGSGDGGCGGGKGEGEAFISGVYFPLLSVLMPKWMELLAGSGDDVDSSKTVLLVSGVGQPRNEEHRLEDNSTEVTAVLMEAFLKRHYPNVRVVRVHSDTNIFRYDDNIRFVKTELLPLLNAERSQMAEKYGEDWQDMMHITMSFADGSPARISSINAALRHFRPSFIHIWELKTFWHEKAICEDDVEVHTFEDIDMQPPMPVSEVDAPTAMIIAEMQRLRDDLERVLAAPPRGAVVGGDARDDLASFWLRKTKKPVLAVLLVQKKGGQPQLFRGTNMEVSMPTGSLCAERNVIGSALTSDLSLLRRDIKAVAVLSVAHLGGSPASTATATAAAAAAAAGAIDGGRKEGTSSSPGITAVDCCGGQSGRLGAAAGLGPAMGSSVTTPCAPSPLSLTPAMKVSPKSAVLRTVAGGGAEDKERLEGVRQALFAVASETSASATTPAAAAAAAAGAAVAVAASEAAEGSPKGSGFFRPSSDGTNTESNSVIDGRPQQQEAGAPSPANPRVRSESCTDELLAAGGRVATEHELSRHPGGGCCGAAGGGGADEGRSDSAAARGQVSRSQSLDLGRAAGGEHRQPPPGGGAEEELSRRKVLRKTKVVRSIASTPNRGVGSGGIAGGAWDKSPLTDSGGSGGGRGDGGGGMYSNDKGGGGGSNHHHHHPRTSRSSVVAHVPPETLCSNPLKPCGACMEWLKKIAEVNPDFKVITFTDSRCGGVYIEDVAQIP
ncbi:unnamed protein product [Ectocarpus fasciculatus]